jgi:hypothetical protein
LDGREKLQNEQLVTMGIVVDRYKIRNLPIRYSTRASYLSCLDHIKSAWQYVTLAEITAKPYMVEQWLAGLNMAPKTKAHIKALLYRLFECAMKWRDFPAGRNPMGLVEVKGVTKRRRKPRVLTHDEFARLLNHIREPYRAIGVGCTVSGTRRK